VVGSSLLLLIRLRVVKCMIEHQPARDANREAHEDCGQDQSNLMEEQVPDHHIFVHGVEPVGI
jgi:hypothetical protein